MDVVGEHSGQETGADLVPRSHPAGEELSSAISSEPNWARASRAAEEGSSNISSDIGYRARPIKRNIKLSETVAQQIVQDITARGLKAEATLPSESEMSRMYGVGRASLREALRILEIHGLIVLRPGPGGGPVVAGVSSLDLGRMTALYFHIAGATYADLLGTLQEMGPLTVRMAAERQDEESIRKLDTYISERPAHVHYQSGYLEVYSGFYSMIAEMTGNPILNMAASALAGLFLDRLGSLEISQELQDQFLGDQMAVAEFIRSGYVGRAVQLITEHLQRFAQLIAVKDPALLNEVVTWS